MSVQLQTYTIVYSQAILTVSQRTGLQIRALLASGVARYFIRRTRRQDAQARHNYYYHNRGDIRYPDRDMIWILQAQKFSQSLPIYRNMYTHFCTQVYYAKNWNCHVSMKRKNVSLRTKTNVYLCFSLRSQFDGPPVPRVDPRDKNVSRVVASFRNDTSSAHCYTQLLNPFE